MAEKKTTDADIMASVEAKIAEMLKAAEAKAEEIVKQAEERANAGAMADKALAKQINEANARGEEYVEVKLFKDNGKYKDDVFVQVNGENCVIQRGIRTKIKRKFAEVLDASDFQDYQTAKMMEGMASDFQREAAARNL